MNMLELKKIRELADRGEYWYGDLESLLAVVERVWAMVDDYANVSPGSRISRYLASESLRVSLTGPPAAPGGEGKIVDTSTGAAYQPDGAKGGLRFVCGKCGGSGIHANPVAPRAACPDCHGTGYRTPPEPQQGPSEPTSGDSGQSDARTGRVVEIVREPSPWADYQPGDY